MQQAHCRFCRHPLTLSFADLGLSPLANAYLKPEAARQAEAFYPLHAFVCENCLLVQLEAYQSAEQIFSDYAYFSSFSASWLAHCEAFSRQMQTRFGLDETRLVAEIASNDGYLLQYFKPMACRILGIEPARNVAEIAKAKGIPTEIAFFGTDLARRLSAQGQLADLLIGNNVLAHVPDLNDFVAGLKLFLAPGGTISIEFPHLLELMRQNQYDTIYHEHFSYFSLHAAQRIFRHHGLEIYDAESLPTHGGSLRIFAGHAEAGFEPSLGLEAILARESAAGLLDPATYTSFQEQVVASKFEILSLLLELKRAGKRIVGYGAPAKGNTLLNYCGIKTDFLDYTVDLSPHKQGLLLPGTRIPIYAPEKIDETRPDYVLILPWNLIQEIRSQMARISEWGGRFISLIPHPVIL